MFGFILNVSSHLSSISLHLPRRISSLMRLCVGVGGERGVSENAFSKSKLSCVINVSIEKLFQNLSVITTKPQCDNNRMP